MGQQSQNHHHYPINTLDYVRVPLHIQNEEMISNTPTADIILSVKHVKSEYD